MLTLPVPHRGLNHLTFSPCGRFLAAGGNGWGVHVWEPAAGPGFRTYVRQFPYRTSRVDGLAFDPTTGRLLAAGRFGLVCLDPERIDAPAPPDLGLDTPPGPEFVTAAGGTFLLAPTGDRVLADFYYPTRRQAEYRATPGGWVEREADPLPADCRPVALLPAGRVAVETFGHHPAGLAVVGGPAWRVDPLPFVLSVGRAAVAADGRLVAARAGSRLHVWHPATGATASAPADGPPVTDLAVHPTAPLVLTAGPDGLARTWDADTLTERAAHDFGAGRLRACAVAPDGLTAAVAGPTRVVLFDLD